MGEHLEGFAAQEEGKGLRGFRILAVPLSSGCVTLGRSLNLSVPPFPYLENWNIDHSSTPL